MNSVDIFSYSFPLGILGSDGIRIPLKLVLGGVRIVALSISTPEPRLLISNIVSTLFF